jgi:hypothetical protein
MHREPGPQGPARIWLELSGHENSVHVFKKILSFLWTKQQRNKSSNMASSTILLSLLEKGGSVRHKWVMEIVRIATFKEFFLNWWTHPHSFHTSYLKKDTKHSFYEKCLQ